MPSTYAHFVFTRTVLHRASQLTLPVHFAPSLFGIGGHGPDILFYYKPLHPNPVNKIGYGMHARPAKEFFVHAKSVLIKEPCDSLEYWRKLSYVLGFICHFALDHACHSYIQSKIHQSHVTHTEIEGAFDRALLLRDGKNPKRQRLTEHIQPSLQNANSIAPFFPKLNAKKIQKALNSMVSKNNFLVAPNPIKRALIFFVLKFSGNYKEMHGLVLSAKADARCEDSCLRLEKLMNAAVADALRLIQNYLEFLQNTEELCSDFDATFSYEEGWEKIPVLTQEEERCFEI